MTRILADLPDEDIKWLDQLAAEQEKSRAAVLRDAVAAFRHREEKTGIEKYFGLWERHGSTVDGLEYERSLRDEWPDTSDIVPPAKRDAA
jgi:Ribbon-helix-helix protein, copG family